MNVRNWFTQRTRRQIRETEIMADLSFYEVQARLERAAAELGITEEMRRAEEDIKRRIEGEEGEP